ncbi:hypothetical protein E8E13_002977 [Curvularia kusanoi]|uniref:Hypervirulence associated protein TUDOR domain-containing protein n=1 Tax=Curvularia kusanoi TaxID=90978 RepID=A0A9P4WE02_CURKU|nr:hypothetical protein E8E13_002977 [Curvularia kusanoi]
MGAGLGIWITWAEADKESGIAPVKLDTILGWCNAKVEATLLQTRFETSGHTLCAGRDRSRWMEIHALYESYGRQDDLRRSDDTMWASTDVSITSYPVVSLAKFLRKNNYQDPLDKTKLDNYADLTGGEDFFATCAKDLERLGSSFIGLMTAVQNYKMPWAEVYDTTELIAGADLNNARHSDLPSDILVVQDTPEVIAMTPKELDPRVRKMAYDFFTPQPFVDSDVLRILANVKDAMEGEYSRLLIYEVVLPAKGATSLMTALDLSLMIQSRERKGDKVSWNWGSGQPGGEVAEVKEKGEIAIESNRGNTIKKNAEPENPAVHIERSGNDVVKRASELQIDKKAEGSSNSDSKQEGKESESGKQDEKQDDNSAETEKKDEEMKDAPASEDKNGETEKPAEKNGHSKDEDSKSESKEDAEGDDKSDEAQAGDKRKVDKTNGADAEKEAPATKKTKADDDDDEEADGDDKEEGDEKGDGEEKAEGNSKGKAGRPKASEKKEKKEPAKKKQSKPAATEDGQPRRSARNK